MDLFTLSAKLKLDSSEFESGIKQSEGRFKQFGQKVGSAAKTVAKVGGAAMVAAGTAVGAFMKKALDARGALEQAMGGSEAVFGKYSKSMVAQAKDAYETMGLSQREFLETSNKLGSLLQGSGYKEAEAAKTATKVMQRASDVASIMGIDVADAMTAVTAAAKGNFTMMDNLGVAINATTIESYAQSKGIKKTYNEMTTAEKVGLAYQLFLEKTAKYAGNYAKENETYAGSINTLKKAWENFMSGSGNAKAVVTSLKRVVKVIWKNITELAPELAKGLGEMVKTAFKSIKWPAWHDVKVYAKRAWESIQKGLNSLGGLIFGKNKKGQVKWPTWNDVKSAAVSAWNAIKKEAETAAARILGSLGIPVITKMGKQGQEDIIIWPSWEDVRESAIQAWENIKAKAAAIVDEAGALVFGRKEDGTVAWPTWEDVKAAGIAALDAIKDAAVKLGGIIFGRKEDGSVDWPTWEDVKAAAETAWNGIKTKAAELSGLVFGDGQTIVNNIKKVFEDAAGAVKEIDWTSVGSAVFDLITAPFDAIVSLFNDIFSSGKDEAEEIDWTGLGDSILGFLKAALSGIGDLFKGFFEAAYNKSVAVWTGIGQWFTENVINPIGATFNDIGNTIKGKFDEAYAAIKGVFENASTWFTTNVVDPIIETFNGIGNAFKKKFEDAYNLVKGVFNDVKTWFENNVVAPITNAINSILAPFQAVVDTIEGWLGKKSDKTITVTTRHVDVFVGSSGTPHTGHGNTWDSGDDSEEGSHAKGSWNIPYDNYRAVLHRNEMVLTASQARQYREGKNSNLDLGSLTRAIVSAVREGMENAHVNTYLDGKEVTDNVSRRMANEFKAMRYAT